MKANFKVIVSHRFTANGTQRQIGRVEFAVDGASVIETSYVIDKATADEIIPGFGELLALSARTQAGKVLREYVADSGRWASVWTEETGIQCDVYPITPIPVAVPYDPSKFSITFRHRNRVPGGRWWMQHARGDEA